QWHNGASPLTILVDPTVLNDIAEYNFTVDIGWRHKHHVAVGIDRHTATSGSRLGQQRHPDDLQVAIVDTATFVGGDCLTDEIVLQQEPSWNYQFLILGRHRNLQSQTDEVLTPSAGRVDRCDIAGGRGQTRTDRADRNLIVGRDRVIVLRG